VPSEGDEGGAEVVNLQRILRHLVGGLFEPGSPRKWRLPSVIPAMWRSTMNCPLVSSNSNTPVRATGKDQSPIREPQLRNEGTALQSLEPDLGLHRQPTPTSLWVTGMLRRG